jgi:hypothetical protein
MVLSKPLDLLKVIRRMSYGEIKSINVQIGEKEKFATRLVIEKATQKSGPMKNEENSNSIRNRNKELLLKNF